MPPSSTSPSSSGRYTRTGAPPPRTPTLRKNICPIGSSTPCGTPTKPTIEPARAMSSAVCIDWPVPTHSSVDVDADAAGQLLGLLDRLVAALGDDVGRAELRGQLLAAGVPGQGDDALCAETLGGEHAGEPDGSVADDRDGLAG